MYACMHACVHACMHVHMYACMRVCMSERMQEDTRKRSGRTSRRSVQQMMAPSSSLGSLLRGSERAPANLLRIVPMLTDDPRQGIHVKGVSFSQTPVLTK